MGRRKKKHRSAKREAQLKWRRQQRKQRLALRPVHPRDRWRPLTNAEKVGPLWAESRYKDLTECDKALNLAQAVKEVLAIRVDDQLLRVTRGPDPKAIESLAMLVCEMWPKDFRPRPPSASDELAVLYLGDRLPNAVLNAVTRLSLYADRIYIPNAFANTLLHHPQQSPLIRPAMWWTEFCKRSLLLVMLEPWIRADVVELIHNPLTFDVDLFAQVKDQLQFEKQGAAFKHAFDLDTTDKFAEMCLHLEESRWAETLTGIGMGLDEVEQTIRAARRLKVDEPVRAAIPWHIGNIDGERSEMTLSGPGLGFSRAKSIALSSGCHLVAGDRSTAALMAADTESFRSEAAIAAQALSSAKLNFLNDVNNTYAVELRADGALRDFRSYLGAATRNLSLKTAQGTFNNEALRDFEDRFTAEYENIRRTGKTFRRSSYLKQVLR